MFSIKMITRTVFSAVFLSLAFSDPKLNQYMDDTLARLPVQARVSGADPAELPRARFIVRGNGLTENDLEVVITRGSVSGLSKIKRRGNCSYDYFDSNLRRSCFLNLNTVRIVSNVDVIVRFQSEKDDSAFAMTHSVVTSTRFEKDSFLLLQLSADGNNHPSVKILKAYPATMTSSVTQGIPYLIKSRWNAFGKQLNTAVVEKLSLIISGQLKKALDNSVKNRKVP